MHRFFLCPLRQVVSLRHAGAVDLRCGLVDSTKDLYKWKDRSGPARTARTDPQWPGPRWPGPPGPARTGHESPLRCISKLQKANAANIRQSVFHPLAGTANPANASLDMLQTNCWWELTCHCLTPSNKTKHPGSPQRPPTGETSQGNPGEHRDWRRDVRWEP